MGKTSVVHFILNFPMSNYSQRSQNAVRRALADTRSRYPYAYAHRFRREIEALRAHYGDEGEDAAATMLRDTRAVSAFVDEAAIDHLVAMRERRHRPITGSGLLASSLRKGRLPWYAVEYGLACKRLFEPDWTEVGQHACATGNALVDRFIGEASIHLAEEYDRQLDERYRWKQHESLRRELGLRSTGFAKNSISDQVRRHLKIAEKLGELDHARITIAAGGPVEVRGKSLSKNNALKSFNEGMSSLETLGPWDRAAFPLRLVAYARAVQCDDISGLAFTVNLSLRAIGSAGARQRAAASVLQERVTYHLRKELGFVPPFYFVLEQGLTEKAHLHGAARVLDTNENREKLRLALHAIAKHGNTGRPRSVDVRGLTTPVLWAAYALKKVMTTKGRSKIESLIAANQALRKRAREITWPTMQEEQRTARKLA